MLRYSEYPIFERYQDELNEIERIVQRESAQKIQRYLQDNIDIIASGRRRYAYAFHQIKRYARYLPGYEKGKVAPSSVQKADYELSGRYYDYLKILTKRQALQIKIDRIDRYVQSFGDAVINISMSHCSVSTYVQVDANWFAGLSSTDIRESLLGNDRLEKMPATRQIQSCHYLKVRISDHLPGAYADRSRISGDMDIIMDV